MSYKMQFMVTAACAVLSLLAVLDPVAAKAYPAEMDATAEMTVHQLTVSPDTPYPVYIKAYYPNPLDRPFRIHKDISAELAARLKNLEASQRLLLLVLTPGTSLRTPGPVPETLEVCLKGSDTGFLQSLFPTGSLSFPLDKLTDTATSALLVAGALDPGCSKVILSDGSEETLRPEPGVGKSSVSASYTLTILEIAKKVAPRHSVMGFPGGSPLQLRLSGGSGAFRDDQDYKPGFGGGGPRASDEIEIQVTGLNEQEETDSTASTPSASVSQLFVFQITDPYGNEQLLIKNAYDLVALLSDCSTGDGFADWLLGASIDIQGLEPGLAIKFKEWIGDSGNTEPGDLISCPTTGSSQTGGAGSGLGPSPSKRSAITSGSSSGSSQPGERASGGSGGEESQGGYCTICQNFVAEGLISHLARMHSNALDFNFIKFILSEATGTVATPSGERPPSHQGVLSQKSSDDFKAALALLEHLPQDDYWHLMRGLGHYVIHEDYGIDFRQFLEITLNSDGNLNTAINALQELLEKSYRREPVTSLQVDSRYILVRALYQTLEDLNKSEHSASLRAYADSSYPHLKREFGHAGLLRQAHMLVPLLQLHREGSLSQIQPLNFSELAASMLTGMELMLRADVLQQVQSLVSTASTGANLRLTDLRQAFQDSGIADSDGHFLIALLHKETQVRLYRRETLIVKSFLKQMFKVWQHQETSSEIKNTIAILVLDVIQELADFSPEEPDVSTMLLKKDIRLEVDDHNLIMSAIEHFSGQWEKLGIALGVNSMRTIKYNTRKDSCWHSLNEVISELLKGNHEGYYRGGHTWNTLIRAAYEVNKKLASEISRLKLPPS